MRLSDVMRSPVVTVSPNETVGLVRSRMRLHGIRHVAVVDGHRLLGVVSDRDVHVPAPRTKRAANPRSNDDGFERTAVQDVMSSPAVALGPTATTREAANIMRGRKIGCIAVVDGERLVGIVTETDMLELVGQPATRWRGNLVLRGGAAPRGRKKKRS